LLFGTISGTKTHTYGMEKNPTDKPLLTQHPHVTPAFYRK